MGEDFIPICDLCGREVDPAEHYQDVLDVPSLCPECMMNLEFAHAQGGWEDQRSRFYPGNKGPRRVHHFKDGISLCKRWRNDGDMPHYDDPQDQHAMDYCKACEKALARITYLKAARLRQRDRREHL